jgi:hypothetical protein
MLLSCDRTGLTVYGYEEHGVLPDYAHELGSDVSNVIMNELPWWMAVAWV